MIENYPYIELEVVDYKSAIEIKQGEKNFVILTKDNVRRIFENFVKPKQSEVGK